MPRRSVVRHVSLVALAAVVMASFNSPALAHIGGHAGGFANGLAHPFYGLDHVLAMVAVGLWASQLGRPGPWLLPLTSLVMIARALSPGTASRCHGWRRVLPRR